MKKTYEFSVDFISNIFACSQKVKLVKGDNKTIVFSFAILNEVPNGTLLLLKAQNDQNEKPDEYVLKVINNKTEAIIQSSTLNFEGDVEKAYLDLSISYINSDEKMTIPTFIKKIEILKGYPSGNEPSPEEVSVVEQMTGILSVETQNAQKITNDVKALEGVVKDNEYARNSNENNRKAAEIKREADTKDAINELNSVVNTVEIKLANGEFVGKQGERGEQGIQGIEGKKGDTGANGIVINQATGKEIKLWGDKIENIPAVPNEDTWYFLS